MSRTIFSPGVIVSSTWLNASQNIKFDGLDEDWHFPKLTAEDLNLPSISQNYLDLTNDQVIEGIKTFSEGSSPQSLGFASDPDDILTLKDVNSEGRNFLQINCTEPEVGSVLVFNEVTETWDCTTSLDGGTY